MIALKNLLFLKKILKMKRISIFLFLATFSLQIGLGQNSKDFTPTGDTIWNRIDKNGQKQGFWKKNYPTGKPIYIGYFKNNQPTGELKRFYDNGIMKAHITFDDKSTKSFCVIYYDTGDTAATGFYDNMRKDKTWTYYSYYSHKISSKEEFDKGVKNGTFLYFYENGEIAQSVEWKNDKKDGKLEQFFENGKTKLTVQYINDKRHGKFVSYYPKGQIEILGFYHNGQRIGTWQSFDEFGEKTLSIIYEDGRIVNEDEMTEREQLYFKKLDENIGKIQEPTESIFEQKPK